MSQAENDRRIDYVEFGAHDIAATKRFYTEAFGWPFEDWGPDYISFHDGRLAGGFHRVEAGEATSGGPLVVLYATDLAAQQARIVAAGGRVLKEPFTFPGGRRFHFADPSGNELAVWSEG